MRSRIEDFLTFLDLERGFSDTTIMADRNDLRQFLSFLGGLDSPPGDWNQVDKGMIVSYILDLKEREYASATVARKVASLKSLFHFLAGDGTVRKDPAADLDSPRIRKCPPRAISREDVQLLLDAPGNDGTPRCLRNRAILELLYATGMRVTELVSLDMGDVNLASASVRCIGRGSRERVIPLYRRCVGALEAYIEQGRDRLLKDPRERSLFLNHRGERLTRQGLWLIIKGYVESAGISSEVTPHTLRHSFAIHMLDGGVDLGNVQRLLGHANRSTTRVYAQVSSEWPTRPYDDAHPRTH